MEQDSEDSEQTYSQLREDAEVEETSWVSY